MTPSLYHTTRTVCELILTTVHYTKSKLCPVYLCNFQQMLSSVGSSSWPAMCADRCYALLGNSRGKEIIQDTVVYVYLIFPMSVRFYFVSSLGIRYAYIQSNILKCIDYISVNKETYHIHIPRKCFLIFQIKALPQDKDFNARQICPRLPR